MTSRSLVIAARMLSSASGHLARQAANFSVSGVYFSEDKENDAALAAVDGAGLNVDGILAAIDAGNEAGDTGPYAYIAQVGPDVLRLSESLHVVQTARDSYNRHVTAASAPHAKVYALSKCAPDVQELIDARNAAVDRNGELLTLMARMRRFADATVPYPADLDNEVTAALSGFKAPEPVLAEAPAKVGRVVDKAAVRLIERSLRMLQELGRGERLRKALGDYLEGVRRETEN